MTYSLFSTKAGEAGFRLHAYEIYNWGTFDGVVWTIRPEGETSLLTGANASGKTTLVDGLLTLLVPEKRGRAYNQTAGAKGERTEESYVLGEYGETDNEETNTREIKKLRTDKSNTHSILLAVFKNEDQFVSLVQCRWFSGSELKRVFIVAYKQLSISEDFSPFDSAGEWRKRLKQKYPKQGAKEVLHFIDSPGEYGRMMRKAFGMRSEKAHSLFGQTIGLKVLGNLDEFVRNQMLEERESEVEFQKIKVHFKTLYDAHKAIEKAHEQIRLLTPIREKYTELTNCKALLFQNDNDQQILPYWFAQKKIGILQDYLIEQEEVLQKAQDEHKELGNLIQDFSDKERELDIQIRNDEVGKQITTLEKKNKELEDKKKDRQEELNKYNKLAEQLELSQNPSAELFEQQQKKALENKKATKEIFQQKKDEEFQLKMQRQKQNEQFAIVSKELQELRTQKNNITGRVAEIRRELLIYVGAAETEIPFIGELVKVKSESKHWEPAIEKVLHSFALRLIVPDKYYKSVNKYVNENDLKGRIVYQRYKAETFLSGLLNIEENKLYNKLEFKKSSYTDWIENEIKKSFDYVCTDDLEDFYVCEKAITSKGLVKNTSRHEKDDRPEVKNRQQFVLGWDNKDKIASVREQAEKLDTEIKDIERKLSLLEKEQKRIENHKLALEKITDFNLFKKIDWWAISDEIQDNENKISELQKTDDRVNTLKKQRDGILKNLNDAKVNLESKSKNIHVIELDVQQKRGFDKTSKTLLESYQGLDVTNKAEAFEQKWIIDVELTIHNIDTISRKFSAQIEGKIEEFKGKIRDTKTAAETLMRDFTHPINNDILSRFDDWKTDTHKLSDSAEFIEEYVNLLEQIENQELAEHKQRFKKYLDEEMITKMSDFNGWLMRQEEDIEENIEALNASLAKINFKSNPPTFIRLHVDKDYSPRIKEFRFRLNDWKPNIAEYQRTQDDTILEQSFMKIKSLLDELTNEESFRKEVLDVRNWLKFKAVEHYREDNRIFRSYTGTAKLSGGEGAQLTYTILGSAIAYQFGIHSEGLTHNSFRFICVDEAFSKQDDEKARFLMELCKQLHLQLMVVSPAKAEEVAIVEEYIAKVHFIQRKNNKESVLYDMPIKQFQVNRKEYLEQVDVTND
jgi:uncharacterized protein YPO0396